MEWLKELWVWLDANHNQIAALSSLVFGVSTASIAVMAYRLNYRNNFGTKPLVLITSVGGGTELKTRKPLATFKCEIWNRQKYAIDLRYAAVKYTTVRDKPWDASKPFEGPWLIDKRGWRVTSLEETLEPGKHTFFEASFMDDDRRKAFEMPKVKISYFDPMSGGTREAKSGARQRWRNAIWMWRVRRSENKADMKQTGVNA